MSIEFRVGRELGYLILSLNVIGFVLGPTFWAPGTGLIGRRLVFVRISAVRTIAILAKRGRTIWQPCSSRDVCGFFAVALLTNGAGVFADICDPVNRGITTSVFHGRPFWPRPHRQ